MKFTKLDLQVYAAWLLSDFDGDELAHVFGCDREAIFLAVGTMATHFHHYRREHRWSGRRPRIEDLPVEIVEAFAEFAAEAFNSVKVREPRAFGSVIDRLPAPGSPEEMELRLEILRRFQAGGYGSEKPGEGHTSSAGFFHDLAILSGQESIPRHDSLIETILNEREEAT